MLTELDVIDGGLVRSYSLVNDAHERIVLARNGEVSLVDEKGREMEKYAKLIKEANIKVNP